MGAVESWQRNPDCEALSSESSVLKVNLAFGFCWCGDLPDWSFGPGEGGGNKTQNSVMFYLSRLDQVLGDISNFSTSHGPCQFQTKIFAWQKVI